MDINNLQKRKQSRWVDILIILLGLTVGIIIIVVIKKLILPSPPTHPIIHQIKNVMDNFVDKLKQAYPNDERVDRLQKRYNNTKLFESNTHETYTLNKGEEIVMCIKDYSKEKQIHDDFNLLIFVGLHELAHIMSISTDHTNEFWTNFKFILRNAAEMDFYKAIDYSMDPVNYCAMMVYDNPYFYDRTKEEFIGELQSIIN